MSAVSALQARFPQATERGSLDHPAANVPAVEVLNALKWLKDEGGYDFLADLTAIDGGEGASPRFTVVYHLYSTARFEYFRLAANCPDDAAPSVPSATGIWPAADWHEREAYDMFGITFSGHPNLRRILMWE